MDSGGNTVRRDATFTVTVKVVTRQLENAGDVRWDTGGRTAIDFAHLCVENIVIEIDTINVGFLMCAALFVIKMMGGAIIVALASGENFATNLAIW